MGARTFTDLSISMRPSGPKLNARSFWACSLAALAQECTCCADAREGSADVIAHNAAPIPSPQQIDVLSDIGTHNIHLIPIVCPLAFAQHQTAFVSRSHSVRSLSPMRPPLIARVTLRMSSSSANALQPL